MFVSFFPSPRAFFWSAALWTLAAVLFWFFVASDMGALIGLPNPPADTPPIPGVWILFSAQYVWFYIYFAIAAIAFALVWFLISPHPWFKWSVLGSIVIVFFVYFQVQISVAFNAWSAPFFDLIQKALTAPNATTAREFYEQFAIFAGIAVLHVIVRPVNSFLVNHYVFRWRTAMNHYYLENWPRLRTIEGAAQRVQEDTMRFARTVEGLGVELVSSVMTLIAFLPVLRRLEVHVEELPIVGIIPYPLITAAILWSFFGTGFHALIGMWLPGLEFRNQRVEAAYRKELVYGEDNGDRAHPDKTMELFADVRRNYMRLYFHYFYFNVGRYVYFNVDNIAAYAILVPSLVAAKITLGIFQQVNHAFDQVRESFQYLVNAWTTIIDLISVQKRLRAFEAVLKGEPLPAIDQEPGGKPAV